MRVGVPAFVGTHVSAGYSPDFNPIESLLAWLKARLRSLKARSVKVLLDGIGAAHGVVSRVLARG